MTFFDTHFHLPGILDKGIAIDELGHLEGMDIGCEPGDIDRRAPLIARFPGLFHSIAAGPWCAGHAMDVDGIVARIEHDARSSGAHFIGEIGLDYHWNYGTEGDMESLFEAQLELAGALDLPVAIHNRDADEQTIRILRRHHVARGGIIHCFSSDRAAAEAFLELGYHISFAGNVTYKSNSKLVEALKAVPLDRLLLETDSPYLAPVPMRGRVNTPLNIAHTYAFVAAVKGIDAEALDRIVRDNFYSIVRYGVS